MKLTEFYLRELDREVERLRRALGQVPAGKYDWKPHHKEYCCLLRVKLSGLRSTHT